MSNTAAPSRHKIWVANNEILHESVKYLRTRTTHPHFIGYLHLRKLYGQQRTSEGSVAETEITSDWGELKRYLKVEGGPPGSPHLRPFWHKTRSAGYEDWSSDWMGPNLSGSFSPSSIRRQESAVFGQVVDVGENGDYLLNEDHISVAFEKLLFKEKMDAVFLSLFLHRDWGYVSAEKPTPKDVAACFRDEFQYKSPTDDAEFRELYVVQNQYASSSTSWFSPHEDSSST